MKCPKCNSEEKSKNGFVANKQRYKCKNCKCQYTQSYRKGKPIKLKIMAYMLYLEGLGFRSIARLLKVSNVSVLNWIKDFSMSIGIDNLNRNIKKSRVIEIDEMWHYLGKKKEKSGYGLLFVGTVDRYLDGKLVVVEEKR